MAPISLEMTGGVKIPAVGLGTWQVKDEAELVTALNAALETGYRHIDTAFVYENEHIIGRVLKEWFTSGRLKREDLFITTKLPGTGVHRDRVEYFMKKSLEALQLDYVDLYLIHFPVGVKYVEGAVRKPGDPIVTEKEDHVGVWKKMEEQVDAGRTRAIGLSNFNVRQIERILKSARMRPQSLQVELHVLLQQNELVDFCHKNGIVVVAYSPLANPSYNKFLKVMGMEEKPLPSILQNPVVKAIADKHKKTTGQIALRFLIERNIVAIPKSVTPSRIKENFEIFDFKLDAEDMKKLRALDMGEKGRVCDFRFFKEYIEHPEFPFPK